MYLDWTKHLKDEDQKKKFEQEVYSSKRILERMQDILLEYERSLNRSETDIKTFDTPNWEHKQAYKNGYRACLYKMLELTDLDKKVTYN